MSSGAAGGYSDPNAHAGAASGAPSRNRQATWDDEVATVSSSRAAYNAGGGGVGGGSTNPFGSSEPMHPSLSRSTFASTPGAAEAYYNGVQGGQADVTSAFPPPPTSASNLPMSAPKPKYPAGTASAAASTAPVAPRSVAIGPPTYPPSGATSAAAAASNAYPPYQFDSVHDDPSSRFATGDLGQDDDHQQHQARHQPTPSYATSSHFGTTAGGGRGGGGGGGGHHGGNAKRPGYGRQDSESWSRLLQGAGYPAPAEDEKPFGHAGGGGAGRNAGGGGGGGGGGAGGYGFTPNASQSSLDLASGGGKRRRPGGYAGGVFSSMTSFVTTKLAIYLFVLGLLWIPGIVALTAFGASASNGFDRPTVWHVGLFWWSIWLSSVFVGLFVTRYVATFVPLVMRVIFGRVLTMKNLITFVNSVRKYLSIFLEAILVWVLWLVLIWNNYKGTDRYLVDPSALNPLAANSTNATTAASSSSSSSTRTSGALVSFGSTGDSGNASTADLMVTIGRFWFALVICAGLLLVEKIAIQAVALSFHRVSYQQRLQENKFHIKVLVTLFENSRADLQRRDTSLAAERRNAGHRKGAASVANVAVRTKLGVQRVTRQSASVLGSMAEEIIHESAGLNPFSSKAIVISALSSPKETRKLSRRLFYSFATPTTAGGVVAGSKGTSSTPLAIHYEDVAGFFPDQTTARAAYEMLDRDANGSCDRDECEMAVMEVHRERLTLSSSMSDVDSAVSNLDSIFMSFYAVIALVIIAALLSTKFSSLVTSFSTTLLALSWALGSTVQEILASVLFVFCKHPLDVGDHVAIPGLLSNGDGSEATFIVQELQLLSTVLKTTQGKVVQTGNFQLAQKPIVNLRRSGPIEEPFGLEVAYETTFEQLEELRHRVVEWTSGEAQKRDFLPGCNVSVDSLSDQSKLKLTLAIRYKSNWQHPGIKARRRNRWVCELKQFLADLKIYGPKGDPKAVVVQRVAHVDPPAADDEAPAADGDGDEGWSKLRPSQFKLMDDLKQASNSDVYGERAPGGGGGGGAGSAGGMDTPDGPGSRATSPAASMLLSHRFGGAGGTTTMGGGGGGGGVHSTAVSSASSPLVGYRNLPTATTAPPPPPAAVRGGGVDIEMGSRKF